MSSAKWHLFCLGLNMLTIGMWSIAGKAQNVTNIYWRGWLPGGRLNKKDGLTRYGNSHVKDKTS